MKVFLLLLISAVGATLISGCCCNPGYHAPAYKPVIVGCVPAFVPTR